MKQTLLLVFETFFPMRTDARIVHRLSPEELLSLYHPTYTEDTHTLLPFSDQRVRACIHEAKFHDNQTAIALLGCVLSHHLTTYPEAVIIPIPLSHNRQRERGYNQITRIVQASTGKRQLAENILFKHTDTKPQTKLNKRERLTNVAGAFAVFETPLNKKRIAGAHILILDDVTTTGATLEAAKAALSPLSPASVTCLALAH